MKPIPLFERFSALAARVPWTPIVTAPTPVETLPGFAARHGLTSFHVKREDRTHEVIGGNKVRGLEFLLGDALKRKADTLVTFGAAGSNHIAATAVHGRALGMETTAFVMAQPAASYVPRNLLDGLASGARLVPVNAATVIPRIAAEWLRLRRNHRKYRVIPPGGTTPLSCLGHVNAGLELRAKIDAGLLPPPDHIIVGLGSLGTAAGLLLGLRLAGLRTRIIGVVVFHRWYCTARRCAALARRTLKFMQQYDPSVPNINLDKGDIEIVGAALGRGYAHPTAESTALAAELTSSKELDLDPTYTAKTLAGGLSWLKSHQSVGTNVLYWHTFHARGFLTPDERRAATTTLPRALHDYFDQP